MLEVLSAGRFRDCEGTTRRNFLRVGTLAAAGLTLPALLQARAAAAAAGRKSKNSSVVWLWLGGGATHIETFDPKMDATSEIRSVTGEVASAIPGITLGGTFPRIAQAADKLAIVRSFAHTNSGHGGGTHFVMTGYDNKQVDNGGRPSRPALGSILARVRGASDSQTGLPNYVRVGGNIQSGGAAFLGTAYGPFDQDGQARKSMTLSLPENRVQDRRQLLTSLDGFQRKLETNGASDDIKQFEQQAYNLVFGKAASAFDIQKESPETRERYGKGLGAQMLAARRLCEAGCGFVTVAYGGWDMHGQIAKGLQARSPQMDQAVAAFIADIHQRGLNEDILLVITGEFGRTPRINQNAGRDHWAPLSTLALAGGGLRMGQVIGDSTSKADAPRTNPITPRDLMATIFHVLGIDPKIQYNSFAGRPTYMLENGQPIAELV